MPPRIGDRPAVAHRHRADRTEERAPARRREANRGTEKGPADNDVYAGNARGNRGAVEVPVNARGGGGSRVSTVDARRLALEGTSGAAPYEKLARLGNFEGFIKTAHFGEIYVRIKQGDEPAKHPPVVYLGGIATCAERSSKFEEDIQAKGGTVITLVLPGQGETLARDIKNNGRAKSLDKDITARMQADAVVETLDAMGVKGPVHATGLSYGGYIAAACKKAHPERFDQLYLIAPYVMSQAEFDPRAKAARDMMFRNPFNPFSYFMGPAMERQATRAVLESTFNFTWPVLEGHRREFIDALTNLTMGISNDRLRDTVKGMDGVNMLVVPQDGASPPELGEEAFQASARDGVFMRAPASDAGHHDLIGANPALCAEFVAKLMKQRRAEEQ
ncbi:MAG: alpha/beta hydrolase [Myxococcota bacterium]